MKVLVIGAGGHAAVVGDILGAAAADGQLIEVVGYLDDRPSSARVQPVLGGLDALATIPHDAAVVAIGDNQVRRRIAERLMQAGRSLAIARHPRAIVAGDVAVGDGAMICAGAIVCVGARVGAGVILNTGCSVDHHVTVGSYAHVGPGARVGGDAVIGEGAFVGIGAVILPRVVIGANATVGAGAVVTRDVAPGTTVVGVPARPLGRLRQRPPDAPASGSPHGADFVQPSARPAPCHSTGVATCDTAPRVSRRRKF